MEQLEQALDLALAAEEDGRVLGGEGFQSRVRWPHRVPSEGIGRIEAGAPQAGQQTAEGPIPLGQVYPLDLVQQRKAHAVLQPQRKHRLAEGARETQLCKAPSRVNRGRAREEDDSVGLAQVSVELLLPHPPRRSSAIRVEVDVQRRKALGLQTIANVCDGGA